MKVILCPEKGMLYPFWQDENKSTGSCVFINQFPCRDTLMVFEVVALFNIPESVKKQQQLNEELDMIS